LDFHKIPYKICLQKGVQQDLTEGDHLKDPGIDGSIILNWILEKWDGDTDLMNVAEDRDRWRSLVNAVMNLRVP
jgi:hypothetical protein